MPPLFVLISSIIIGALVAKLIWVHVKNYLWLQDLSYPGFPFPLVGHTTHLLGVKPEDILPKVYELCLANGERRKLGAVLGLGRLVFLFHPESVQPILSSNVHLQKGKEYDPILPWLNRGLLLSYGSKWRSRRKMLTPSFHFRILDDSMAVFNRCAGKLVDVLGQECKDEDVFPYITRCTLDIMLEAAMGKRLDVQDNRDSAYARAISDMVHLIQTRQKSPWLWNEIVFAISGWKSFQDRCLKELHGFTKQVIGERRKEFKQDDNDDDNRKNKKLAFLDLLLRTGSDGKTAAFTDGDLQEEVDTFMFEGHDTTACSLIWTLLLLANHPEAQQKCYEEQATLFSDPDEDITMDQLSQMPQLEAVIKESLRLYPSVAMVSRRLEKDEVIDGVQMHVGDSAVVMVHILHRNPEVWPEPDRFIPERFIQGSKYEHKMSEHGAYAYVPFSAGPRNCIGQKFANMEEKTVLARVLRKLKLSAVTKIDDEDAKPVIEIITRPFGPIKIKFEKR